MKLNVESLEVQTLEMTDRPAVEARFDSKSDITFCVPDFTEQNCW